MTDKDKAVDMEEIAGYIARTFAGVDVQRKDGDYFFIYDPDRTFEGAGRIPFATLIDKDDYDTVSNLSRAGVHRMNVGVRKETFNALFGDKPAASAAAESGGEAADARFDYTAFDVFMPHPTYGSMFWICILNPGPESFERAKRFLAESYEIAVKRAGSRKPKD